MLGPIVPSALVTVLFLNFVSAGMLEFHRDRRSLRSPHSSPSACIRCGRLYFAADRHLVSLPLASRPIRNNVSPVVLGRNVWASLPV